MGIFYTVFNPIEGPKVLCQVPEDVVHQAPQSSRPGRPVVNFDHIKNYVIPKPALCNHLVTVNVKNVRLVGHPVLISGSQYERNSFLFNFVFLFAGNEESTPYELPIRRLARMFMVLEEQSRYLSRANSLPLIANIIEQIYQDLNNYSECMIPIDDSNSVNMKLFPLVPPPPELKGYYVPITTVRLDRMIDESWDPTMEKIVPHINGINSIHQIADLANANYNLTIQCMQHLLYYRCIVIVDLFQFSNIYAPTPDLCVFLTDHDMAHECQAYVYSPEEGPGHRFASVSSGPNSGVQFQDHPLTPESASPSSYSTTHSSTAHGPLGTLPSPSTLFFLYKSLHQGQTVKEWYLEHRKLLADIDVRRFLSFGLIKGLIYRVHRYPILDNTSRHHHNHHHHHHHRHHHHHHQNHHNQNNSHQNGNSRTKIQSPQRDQNQAQNHGQSPKSKQIDDLFNKILKHPKHFDEICTELRMSPKELEELLQQRGDWTVVSS